MSDDQPQPETKKINAGPVFQPSRELQSARELLDIAEASGHPRPLLDYTGVRALFNTLEAEERKVFDLQMAVGPLALDLDTYRARAERYGMAYVNMRARARSRWQRVLGARQATDELSEMLRAQYQERNEYRAILRELVEEEPLAEKGHDYVECVYCFQGTDGRHLTHTDECIYTRAKELLGE